ncbi:MAG: GNAT family N-acetyltransferase, partial [Steroidobacteraceae bacterium]
EYTDQRWGAAAGGTGFRAFHLDFAASMAKAGRLHLTRLLTREGTLSVLYDVRVGGTEYYLQSGFNAHRSQGLSIGYLHFGYAIEAACEQGMQRFDFLAGRGRHRDYKQDLLTEHSRVVTYQAVRGAAGRTLYATYEALKGIVPATWRPVPSA